MKVRGAPREGDGAPATLSGSRPVPSAGVSRANRDADSGQAGYFPRSYDGAPGRANSRLICMRATTKWSSRNPNSGFWKYNSLNWGLSVAAAWAAVVTVTVTVTL